MLVKAVSTGTRHSHPTKAEPVIAGMADWMSFLNQ
jgi:hypothetical protein